MIGNIKDMLWGIPTVSIILLFGLYFSAKSRFFQLRGIFGIASRCSKQLKIKDGSITALSSIATALGGTVGIGSISGVGIAIAVGGAGSIFWMWVTGFLGCMLKYAETSVAVRYRKMKNGIYCGGAMYALKQSSKRKSAVFFAFSCILASLGTGCLTQSSAIRSSLSSVGIPPYAAGTVLCVFVGIAVFGGRKSIAGISEKIIPAASFIYIILALFLIFRRIDRLPEVFCSIFRSAFGINQIGGGALGVTMSAAVRVGVTRGVFSSEAGMGSSPIVHSANENASPEAQGEWGIIETVADIFVFSTISAVLLLTYGSCDMNNVFFGSLGSMGSILLSALLTVFGFASVISWCFYAEACIDFLFEKPLFADILYRTAVVGCVFIGAVTPVTLIWDISDILNIFMIVPNLYLLLIKRKEICSCFGKKKKQQKQ